MLRICKDRFSALAPFFGIMLLGMTVAYITPEHATAADADKADANKKDADFKVQGEYAGMMGDPGDKTKIGTQVIALGDGKFRAVFYLGGLPGAGWDKDVKFQVEGKRVGKQVEFKNDRGSGAVVDGVMTIKNNDGDVIGKLKKVTRKSPTLGKKPPQGAKVLFDGKNVDQWVAAGGKGPAKMTDDGLLMQGANTKDRFGSFSLHIEFRLPFQPKARGQGRGNSGIYMQGRYEVQMLDSFGLKGEHNECGGIYTIKAPNVNMCLPPLTWQTYDVNFTAAKFDDQGKKTKHARITVRHNGVVIHDDVELPKSTTAAPLREGAAPGFIHLQNHGNPVRYRNIWIVEKKS